MHLGFLQAGHACMNMDMHAHVLQETRYCDLRYACQA